jgi:hypothetical protein
MEILINIANVVACFATRPDALGTEGTSPEGAPNAAL